MSALHWYASLGACAAISMFFTVFHRVRADLLTARAGGVPRAMTARAPRASAPPVDSRSLRERLAAAAPSLQAGLVATAATSIFVMALCLMLCVVLAVRGG